MKKLLLTGISLLSLGIAFGSDFNSPIVINHEADFRQIPNGLVSSSSPHIYYISSDETFSVLVDNSFNEIKRFSLNFGTVHYSTTKRLENVWDDTSSSYKKEWTIEENYNNITAINFDFRNTIFNSQFDNSFYFSQNIFSNDNKYLFVIPDYEQTETTYEHDTNGDGEIDVIETIYIGKATGFKIVDENGTTVSTITPPAGWDYEYITIFLTEDGHFMIVTGMNEDYDKITVVYKINNESSSVEMVNSIESHMSVNPTLSRRDQPVTVTIDEKSKYTTVDIIDTAGRTVMSVPTSGEQQIQLNTSRLRNGVYIVKASDGKTSQETCKIIVK